MKILNAAEMRKVEGGKTFYCKKCRVTLYNISFGQWLTAKWLHWLGYCG